MLLICIRTFVAALTRFRTLFVRKCFNNFLERCVTVTEAGTCVSTSLTVCRVKCVKKDEHHFDDDSLAMKSIYSDEEKIR